MTGVYDVIESTLFFILGFLCAGFLALMIAPAIWRRAVTLTRKRVEASVPLTMDEIQADKDRMRAEFAMSTRRLEMSVKEFKEKATGQIVEINRNRNELRRIAEERDEKHRALTELEARAAELRAEMQQREEQLHRLNDRLAERERQLEERALELEKLGEMFDEASFNASARQIELVSQESKLDKLSDDLAVVRNERKEADKRVREIASENKAMRETARGEAKKLAAAEKRAERLNSTLADRDEKLERHERELAHLREQLSDGGAGARDLDAQLGEERETRVKLEGEVADLTGQLSRLLSGAKGGDVEQAMARLNDERGRLEERLAVLNRENKKLRAEIEALGKKSGEEWSDERRDNALLREQINDLAAEVVAMTAMLDAPNSPIRKALDAAPAGQAGPMSLAERVRALQKAASEG